MLEKEYSWNWGNFFWAILVVILAPNLFFGVLAQHLDLGRPYINIDYALVMLVVILNQRLLGIFFLFLSFFFDALGLVGQVFPILRLTDIFYVFSFVGITPWIYKFYILVFILVYIFCCMLCMRKSNSRKRLEILFCVNVLVLGYFYTAIFGGEDGKRIWRHTENPIIDSQIVFGLESRETGFVQGLDAEGALFEDVKISGATAPWFDANKEVDEKVLLIVSESWGVTDKKLQEAILAPILDLRESFTDWKRGSIDFRGITVQAEMRELCQLHPLHFNFEEHTEELKQCLPNLLKKRGYKTHAFHGAAGLMYDRMRWYPDVGFDKMTFFESHVWPRRCYSFPGACDSDMADYVKKSLEAKGKVFSYWLTLNSHYTYDKRDIHSDYLDCEHFNLKVGSQSCRNFKLHAQFFNDLAGLLKSPVMSNTRVVVVGDHEPPITNAKEKEQYFTEGKVPWISLKVKNIRGAETVAKG
ncbi:sulfatase-like hydrolase/transferase [Microbulbifer halophilus]|uniref:Sulfatase-like hydrolase/transferase n=1 Tax=Microbulbifer halophilus TaxID=453963 RepID=A0ABW5EA62_9GAMM|nr:sulfatase-like hydrolase/transferase [Microbulbifer halophilus]MCW8125641.1 sulfatase-like hydrolase/transferase [Microbulbifer halophilus]